MERVPVKIKLLHPTAKVPVYVHDTDAGADLCSIEKIVIGAGETAKVRTGLAVELPVGYEWQIRPRSGFSYKKKVLVINSPGTVDACYRGEVCILLYNASAGTVKIGVGDRIAQAVLKESPQAVFEVVTELEDSDRGASGFGSTGESTIVDAKPVTSNALPSIEELQEKLRKRDEFLGLDEVQEHKELSTLVTEPEEIEEVNGLVILDESGEAQGVIGADTSSVTDNPEIIEEVDKLNLSSLRYDQFTEIIANNKELSDLFDKAGKAGFALENYSDAYAKSEKESGSTPSEDSLVSDLTITLQNYVTTKETEDSITEERPNQEIESKENPLSSDYEKYSPLVEQAIEALIRDDKCKAQLDLAIEEVGIDHIESRVISRIVKNQASGYKTVVVNELKEVLNTIVNVD